jgi:tetratricopeptide (TPR) repeat protein
LAIYCKQRDFFEEAARYYELASKIFSRDPSNATQARLQLVNGLGCKAIIASKKNNYAEASRLYEQQAKIFIELGKPIEATYCEARKLEAQSREFDAIQDYGKASELLQKASDTIGNTNEKLKLSFHASSVMLIGKLAKKGEQYEKAIEYFQKAAEEFRKASNSIEECMCRGEAYECEAFMLKSDPKRDYGEIAAAFLKGAEYYEKSVISFSLVCKADAYKYLALKARQEGKREEAERLFTESKSCSYTMFCQADSPRRRSFFRQSVLWCEGMAITCKAEKMLMDNIQRKQKMNEVIQLLARASSLFSIADDVFQVEIVAGLVSFAMAIDAFNDGDLPQANDMVKTAGKNLPSGLFHSMTTPQVTSSWRPLAYAVSMMNDFDSYRRKLDTEKGYSFEARIRELLSKMYSIYETIEEISFVPEDDEIGIVFKDATPIEIDALGTRRHDDCLCLLVGEAKNLSKSVPFDEALKFLKKIQFVDRRYAKVANLMSLSKAEIKDKVFVSRTRLDSNAKNLLLKNSVRIIEADSIDDLFKKHHMYRLP